MRCFKTILIVAALVLCRQPIWAYDFVADGIAYNINPDSETVRVTQLYVWDEYMGEQLYPELYHATIPSSVTCDGHTYRVTSIEGYTFTSCFRLRSVSLPNSLTTIGEHAFHGCYNLSTATLGDSVSSMGEGAFRACSNLQSIDLPNSLTSISDEVFNSCSSLASITLGDHVTRIGNWAFESCKSLKSITLPATVESLGLESFNNCFGLEQIISYITTPCDEENFDGVNTSNCVLYVPKGSKSLYQSAEGWKDFDKIIEMSDSSAWLNLKPTQLTLGEGDTYQFNAQYSPDTMTLAWQSSDVAIATVDQNGLVTAIAPGLVTITVSCQEDTTITGICEVAVLPKIQLDKSSVEMLRGDSLQLYATVFPSDTPVSWVSSDKSVVNVNDTGMLRAMGIGSATIIACPAGSNLQAVCQVSVTASKDLNKDSVVDIADINIVINLMLGRNEGRTTLEEADVNGDGTVDVADVNEIINAMLDKE